MTCLFGSLLKLVEDGRPLLRRHLAVELQRAEVGRAPRASTSSGSTHCEKMIALRPLSATSAMSASSCSSLALCAGQRVEVANLLEPHHQLEDVLHRDRLAQRVEVDDALLLGQVVGFALGRRQLQRQSRIDLGRHVGQHVLLGAAQDAVAGQLRQPLGRRLAAECGRDRRRRRC